jgi:hypothetical protein
VTMRTVVRNSFARETITSERVRTNRETCAWCGSAGRGTDGRRWLLRFHVDRDRNSGPILGGRLYCERSCAESYAGRDFDE